MNVTLKLFAAVRDIVGESTRELELERGTSASQVWSLLVKDHPELGAHQVPMVAINEEYAEAGTELEDGDELAFIPPVSGG